MRKIRGGVNPEVIGHSVVGMRQAKSGGILIEVRGDKTQIEAVRTEVFRSAGTEVEVRALQQRAMVEVRDLDQWTTSNEVEEAVAVATGTQRDHFKVVSLRKPFGGTPMALVSMPIRASREVLKSGRLRIGMVSCKIRITEQKPRCFRCLCYGHMSKECSGPDRTECCRRCGEVGHKASVNLTNAPASAVSAFTKVVKTVEAVEAKRS